MIVCMEAKMLAARLLLGWCVPIGRHVYRAVLVSDDKMVNPCAECRVKCALDSDERHVCVMVDNLSGTMHYLERLDGAVTSDVLK